MVDVLRELERHHRQCQLDQAIIDELVIMPPPFRGVATPQPPPTPLGSEDLVVAVLTRINQLPGRAMQRAALRRWWRAAVGGVAVVSDTTTALLVYAHVAKALARAHRSACHRRQAQLYHRWKAIAQHARHRTVLQLKQAELVSTRHQAAREVSRERPRARV